MKLGKVKKSDSQVSKELKGTYGTTIVLMSSNPEELQIVIDKLGNEYDTILETCIIDNGDYATVLNRRVEDK